MDWTQKEGSFDGFLDWSQMEGLADGLDSERRNYSSSPFLFSLMFALLV